MKNLHVLDVLEVSRDDGKMRVDGILVRLVDFWHGEDSEKSEDGDGESGEPRGDVGQGPQDESELDRLNWAFNEDELLELVGDAGGVLDKHISLCVDLFLWQRQILGEDLRERVLGIGFL